MLMMLQGGNTAEQAQQTLEDAAGEDVSLTETVQAFDPAQIDWLAVLSTTGLILAYIAGAIIISWLVRKGLNRFFRKLSERKNLPVQSDRFKTFGQLSQGIATALIWLVAGLMSLEAMNINITPILAAAGVGGIALGLGAQKLMGDLISGTFVLMEDQYRVGDIVKTADKRGIVEAVNLRLVRLRDWITGEVHFIPHSESPIITNVTRDYSRAVLDFGVDYGESIPRVAQMIETVMEQLAADEEYGENIREWDILGVEELSDSAIVFRILLTTDRGVQFGIRREATARLKMAADHVGINIPFPHRTLVEKADQEPRRQDLIDRRDLLSHLEDRLEEHGGSASDEELQAESVSEETREELEKSREAEELEKQQRERRESGGEPDDEPTDRKKDSPKRKRDRPQEGGGADGE